MESAPLLEVRDVTKRFPGVLANDAVSLAFRPGEIHVLLGENGAGKSTLMGILAGMQQPDGGEILVAGRARRIGSPRGSLDLGIGTVFQHVLLVPSLSVIENLLLGGSWWQRQDRAGALARFEALRRLLGVEIDPEAKVGHLSLGQQQQVEIIRALWRDGKVLILDEPTSMLTPRGVRELGEVMRRLRDQGVAIIFITHKLKEAFDLGDRISVLRLGRVAGEIAPDQLRTAGEKQVTDAVVRLMFGTLSGHSDDAEILLGDVQGREHAVEIDRGGAPLLRVEGLATTGEAGACHLHEVGFDVWPGEVFGIAGVDGNGQKDLAEALAGQRAAAAGRIRLGGEEVTRLDVVARRRLGVRYISDERLDEGSVPGLSIATNLVVKQIGEPPHWRRGVTLWGRIFGHARERISEFDIRTPSEHTPIGRLSGGNIQKAILARELSRDASLAIFNKPTYGLDLQNTRLARKRIVAAARGGLATVVISTELDELMEVCDRVAVLYQGELRGVVDNAPGAEERIGLLMTGGRDKAA